MEQPGDSYILYPNATPVRMIGSVPNNDECNEQVPTTLKDERKPQGQNSLITIRSRTHTIPHEYETHPFP
jgi:hypothetical protein